MGFVSADTRWWAAGIAAALGVGAAVKPGSRAGRGRAELPSVRVVIKRRWQLRRIRKRWRKAIGENGQLKVTLRMEDVAHTPHRTPGTVVTPRLLGWWGSPWYDLSQFGQWRPRMTYAGWVLYANGNNIGAVPAAFQQEVHHMQGTWGARGVTAEPAISDVSITKLSVALDDPFEKTIPYYSLPAPSKPKHVVLGRDEDGDPVEKKLWQPHLVVGDQGSGKSSLAHATIAGVLDLGVPFRLWVFDPKQLEFTEYEDAAYRYVRSPFKWVAFLQDICNAMQAKLELMRGKHRECPWDDPAYGVDLVIIDELLSVFNFTDDKDKSQWVKIVVDDESMRVPPSKALRHLLSQCRAAAVIPIALCQLSQKDKLADRDLYPQISMLRVPADEVVSTLGYSAKEHPAHEIPADEAFSGIGWTKTIHGPKKFRGGFLTNEERAANAPRVGHWTAFYRNQTGRLAA
jgi:hypothetical protein